MPPNDGADADGENLTVWKLLTANGNWKLIVTLAGWLVMIGVAWEHLRSIATEQGKQAIAIEEIRSTVGQTNLGLAGLRSSVEFQFPDLRRRIEMLEEHEFERRMDARRHN
jgi:hypothetical protein